MDVNLLRDELVSITRTQSEALEAARKAAMQAAQNEILPKLGEFAAAINLKWARIRGWTPGFNDGEPCTHSVEVDFEDDYYWSPESVRINSDLKKEDRSVAEGILWFLNDYIYEPQLRTDYKVTFTFEGGRVSVMREHYECGY